MKANIIHAAILLLLFCILTSLQSKNQNRVTLNAQCSYVTASGNQIAPKTKMEILDEDNLPVQSARYADTNGKIHFEGLPSGTYKLYCIWTDIRNSNVFESLQSVSLNEGHCEVNVLLKN